MAPLPSLFLSHGAPTLALEDSPAGRFLDGLGGQFPRPSAIVVISAHYSSAVPSAGGAPQPHTVHDFRGFPTELSQLRYPAPGAPELAARITGLWHEAGLDGRIDPLRGLDHGVWVVLHRMYPEADIPVVPVSVDPRGDAQSHYALGRALSGLRAENVLLIGSGGFVHNLGELDWHAQTAPLTPWADSFARWMDEALIAGDPARLLDWERHAPFARRAHPTVEHLMPLFVALGAAGPDAKATRLHRSHQFGSLALDAYAFG
ncbi:MAG: class III extradiol ring-cleavage dioxygenase [Xanthomonadaceae bacterium]|nr:class III extradiol ring-cleavage dioxygenase [Xanthomonadaceae bacterium]